MGKHQAYGRAQLPSPRKVQRGPRPDSAAARIQKGDRKGRPPRPSEDPPPELHCPLRKVRQQPRLTNALGQLPASRPAQGAALGNRISSSTMAPERQVLLSSYFYPFYQQQPKLRDVKERAQGHIARMERP